MFGGGSVVVERGVAIELDPGANLSLKATRDVEIGHAGGTDGQTASLSAPGGAITLGITGNRGAISVDLDPDGFLPDQAIWLGTGARLSVSGAAQLRRDGTRATFVEFRNPTTGVTPPGERVTGTVLGGGSITLAAQRGYVVAESGSVMALDGTSANLNLPGLPGAVQIAKPAGVLTVSTPEGFALDGKVSAAAPKDAAGHALADGGRLNLSVGAGGVGSTDGVSRPYPTGPRTVAIGDYDNLIAGRGAVRGADLAQSLGNGIGYVRTSMLRDAGFDALGLAAGDVVRFDTSLDLNKPLGVQLNAPAIEALPGTQVSLRSTYAQIGDASLNRGQAAAPADSSAAPDTSPQHDTSLRIVAATIDVVGKTGLRGFSSVQLDASESAIGEVRFSALEPNFNFVESLPGQLNFAGDLTIKAAQSYATTATQFTLNGMPAVDDQDPGSRLLVRGVPGGMPQRPPLSAFGSLTVNATDIEQGGVLRQPFGAITLNATRSLTLGDNSVTSVSADGATLPYGQSVNLSGWQLPLVPQPVTAMPINVGVNLNAVTLITSPTASVNARGGGDVQTWEFFPGVGGSRDYFETPGLYAVLPDYAATRALSFAGGQLSPQQAGQEIVITMPGSGLAPGRYTLLPARYALLAGELPHGAYLVSRAADQGKSVLRAPIAQDDGSVVVTASLTGAGSTNVGVPGERFVVEPAATFMAKSDIRLSNVSALLARGAAALGAARPALPIDGARVQVSVTGDAGSSWQAQLDLAAQGGQAGQLDLSAPRVALVDDLAKVSAGALGVSAKTLEDSGAGSVLLGGRRQLDASSISDVPTWRIDASGTARVDVDIGTRPMRLEELLLASSDGIRIADGTQVLANEHGTLGARTLLTQSDGALVAVSANALDLRRTDTTLTKGDLKIGAGSSLVAPQIALDATGLVQIDPGATLSASATIIGARRIVIGAGAAPDPNATVLADRLLDGVRAANDLSLHGYTSIDFIGDQNWSQRPATGSAPSVVLHSIVLDAPAIRGLATMDGVAARTDLAAQDVVIRNTNGAVPDPQMIGQGSLTVQASPPLRYGHTGGLTLGPGAIALGFDQAQLRSTGDIVLQGAGSTNAQQDLTLSAVRVTATTGAAQTINAGGALRIDGMAGGHSLGERVGQGASVTFSGTTIDQAGAVDLPGGAVAFR
ncbi:MAG TPA: hypothetical protein VML58_16435, partial [Burkholderiaceae bacterium]|nr:hypothetical protein [Burkholderiaceae bacterium]